MTEREMLCVFFGMVLGIILVLLVLYVESHEKKAMIKKNTEKKLDIHEDEEDRFDPGYYSQSYFEEEENK
jgi:hypothetical protein